MNCIFCEELCSIEDNYYKCNHCQIYTASHWIYWYSRHDMYNWRTNDFSDVYDKEINRNIAWNNNGTYINFRLISNQLLTLKQYNKLKAFL